MTDEELAAKIREATTSLNVLLWTAGSRGIHVRAAKEDFEFDEDFDFTPKIPRVQIRIHLTRTL